MPRSPRRWTPQEDRILLEKGKQLLSEDKKTTDTAISWSSVSKAIANRNNKDCRKRWFKLTGAKKGLWAASEDERLLEGVQKYGIQWARVAKTVETRNADQCAKRWQHCLDPSLDRSEWTSEKDVQLIAAVKHYGTNWKDIKRFEFPMRSTTNLKNRHTALLRQSSKTPSVYSNKAGALQEPSIEWPSIQRGMPDHMTMDGGDDRDYLESDHNQSPPGSNSTSSLQSESPLECNLSGSLVPDMTPTSASSRLCHFPLDWELPLHQELLQTAESVASNASSSMPQIIFTIDSCDLQTMTSVLEVLTRAKSKVTISINA
ncbi:hypothetical protein L228DRAFT_243496 [Xylona heveae TC161]|uniref:Uncharacterized protein n=1 Tax=Xylona heveae (strain CBS 132557 / TC161) TaxID=1328760 RepID=A0A165K3G1_XYLHT|nr:hypothetical protein L228DRAFT_243496 [Xylona heveae TC161]KZF26943.1 hypothetical protein L228DRAFT_243496 [Xylona heveae TC161]